MQPTTVRALRGIRSCSTIFCTLILIGPAVTRAAPLPQVYQIPSLIPGRRRQQRGGLR
jgi:hypothetical protein